VEQSEDYPYSKRYSRDQEGMSSFKYHCKIQGKSQIPDKKGLIIRDHDPENKSNEMHLLSEYSFLSG
jgi:hypothetical protein